MIRLNRSTSGRLLPQGRKNNIDIPQIEGNRISTIPQSLEKPRAFDPRGQAVLTPSGVKCARLFQ